MSFPNPNPQPGDGAFLLQQRGNKHRHARKKVNTFLRQSPDDQNEVEAEKHGPKSLKTFLRTSHQDGKERTLYVPAHDSNPDNAPRTIPNGTLLSTPENFQHSNQSPPLTFLRQPVDTTYNFANSTPDLLVNSDLDTGMALPPHLRKKKAHPSNPKYDEGGSVREANAPKDKGFTALLPSHPATQNLSDDPTNAHVNTPNGMDIRQKLEKEYGVHVSAPVPAESVKPALVPYPISNEDQSPVLNGNGKTTSTVSTSSKPKVAQGIQSDGNRGKEDRSDQQSKRGGARGYRGFYPIRGGGFQGRRPRGSKWPTAAEQRADPHRWDIKWQDEGSPSSGIDSLRADSGFGNGKRKKKEVSDGIDEETGFMLTDWDGNFAPAPVDWDARPAFRATQSAPQIELWMDKIEEELVGKKWSIPEDQLSKAFADGTEPESLVVGEIAPRYWIPIVIDKQAPQTFWNELTKSQTPRTFDEADLDGARPWWEFYQSRDSNILKPYDQPVIKGIDPDENRNERIARENDYGSDHRTENRKRTEKAKREAEREKCKRAQEKAQKISEAGSMTRPQEKIKPGLNLYIRSAKPDDVSRIRDIYNYYVAHSICTPETERRNSEDMKQRYNDVRANNMHFLVACERGGKVRAGRKNRRNDDGEDLILPDKVVGFATADDYNDMQGMYRFTAEIEVYVDSDYYMKSVGKCLLDKLIGLLDPEYIERGGYDTIGEDMEGIGPSRIIKNVVVHLPYDKNEAERVEWIRRWLTEWSGFKQAGDLQGIGSKEGKSVNLAIFQRTTGATVDDAKPPITMEYPKV